MKLNFNQIKSNLITLLFTNILVTIGAFFSTSFIGRTLGPENFGLISYAIAIGAFFAVSIRFGMDMTLIRDLIHYRKSSNKLLISSVIIRISILSLCFTILLFLNLFEIINISTYQFIIAFSTSLLALQLNNYYDFKNLLKLSSMQNLIYKYSYFLFIFLFGFFSILDIKAVSYIMCITLIVYLYFNYSKINFFEILKNTKIKSKYIFFLLKENKLIWITTLFVSLAYSGNQIIIEKVLDAYQLGIFAACYLFVTAILMFYKQVSRVFKPMMANYTKDKTKNKRFLIYYLVMLIFSGLLFTIPLLLFSKEILYYTFGEKYIEGSLLLKIFSVFILLKSIEIFLTQYFQFKRDYTIVLFTNISFGLSTIILSYSFLPIYGIEAAGISMSIGLTLSFLVLLLLMKKRKR